MFNQQFFQFTFCSFILFQTTFSQFINSLSFNLSLFLYFSHIYYQLNTFIIVFKNQQLAVSIWKIINQKRAIYKGNIKIRGNREISFYSKSIQMINFALINKINEKSLFRDHSFFSNPLRFKTWQQDKTSFDPSKISDLSLQCIGYGQFYPVDIVNRFTVYFRNSTRQMTNLKNLRLKVNGFDLKQCPNLIVDICKTIENMPRKNLKLVELQTTRLINCDVLRDFGQILKSTIRLGIKQRQGLIRAQNIFETLSLQFADWQFLYKGQKSQPNPEILKHQLGIIQDEAFNTDGYCFKKFRLEMSTWYYTQKEAEIFFHSFTVEQFHLSMDSFVRSCYNNMPDLEYFEFDLRNWFSNFQMPKIRDNLMMIPKEGAQNMSINSKNLSRFKKKKQDNRMSAYQSDYDEEDVILFERHIVI